MKHGKKYLESAKLIESSKLYDPDEAVKLALQTAKTKFDETMEISVRLGVDPRQADQQVRGAVVLPHGTGKKVRVLVFAKGEQAKAAEEAGADYVGAEELVAKIQGENWFDFDVVVATPNMMGVVGRLGRVLGPKGLMPNPKSGTVTMDVAKAISEIKAGKVEYRLDKQAIIHCPIGKKSFTAEQLTANLTALMNAINYALELDTRVLVPLEAASDQPDGAAPWAEHPVPAEKAKDLQPWTLRTQKGRCYLPVFTSVKMAEADKGTASRPMAERLLASAMQMALDSDSIDGVVIDPWTSSATLDCSLLNGLLHASHDTDEPGEAELRAGNHAMAEERWDDAMHYYQLSAEEGCAEGLAMMGEMLYEGRGCRKSPAQARKFWKKAADAGDVAAWVALGDDAMVQGKGAGAALRAYRKAQKLCASTPDIAYMPQVCLRVAQYETQYISRKKALAQLAEAKQGFLVRKEEGDETAQSWLDETEAVIRQLLERE